MVLLLLAAVAVIFDFWPFAPFIRNEEVFVLLISPCKYVVCEIQYDIAKDIAKSNFNSIFVAYLVAAVMTEEDLRRMQLIIAHQDQSHLTGSKIFRMPLLE